MTKEKVKKALKPGPRGTHQGYVFLRSGIISKENRHIEKYLTGLRLSYIRELGPLESDLSTGQMILLNQLITCCGFTRLVEEQARKTQNISYLRTAHYSRFMKHARQLCLDLGIKPESIKKDRTEKDYLDSIDWGSKQGSKQ